MYYVFLLSPLTCYMLASLLKDYHISFYYCPNFVFFRTLLVGGRLEWVKLTMVYICRRIPPLKTSSFPSSLSECLSTHKHINSVHSTTTSSSPNMSTIWYFRLDHPTFNKLLHLKDVLSSFFWCSYCLPFGKIETIVFPF